MAVLAITPTSVDLPVGGVWQLAVSVTDLDGLHVDDTVTATVTLPGGSTSAPTVEQLASGIYRASYVTGSAGRYIARLTTAASGAADFTAFITATVAATGMPGLVDLRGDPDADPPTRGYLDRNSWTDEELQAALDAEASAQRRACRVPAAYPPDLREALLRRVSRNLAMREQRSATDPDTDTPAAIPSRDPEVRRLEAPYRRLGMG